MTLLIAIIRIQVLNEKKSINLSAILSSPLKESKLICFCKRLNKNLCLFSSLGHIFFFINLDKFLLTKLHFFINSK